MENPKQLPLLDDIPEPQSAPNNTNQDDLSELGTFKDSMQAPIHGWFRYPAGYSYKFVNMTFNRYGVHHGDWVYDPFSGTGTTLVCAKQQGVNAFGVEAHSFVHWVAEVKLYWEYNLNTLGLELETLLARSRAFVAKHTENVELKNVFPALVYKCYHHDDLKVLYLLREFILNEVVDYHIHNLLKLALTDTLRSAAAAGTGWPYISPRKNNGDKPPKNALALFQKTVRKMYADLRSVTQKTLPCEVYNVLGDSRERQNLPDRQVKLALTSPPYLNNYDYADRTRLETYFLSALNITSFAGGAVNGKTTSNVIMSNCAKASLFSQSDLGIKRGDTLLALKCQKPSWSVSPPRKRPYQDESK